MYDFMYGLSVFVMIALLSIPVLAFFQVSRGINEEFFSNEDLRYPQYRAQIREIYAEKTAEKENE